jgi:Aldolase/RraA
MNASRCAPCSSTLRFRQSKPSRSHSRPDRHGTVCGLSRSFRSRNGCGRDVGGNRRPRCPPPAARSPSTSAGRGDHGRESALRRRRSGHLRGRVLPGHRADTRGRTNAADLDRSARPEDAGSNRPARGRMDTRTPRRLAQHAGCRVTAHHRRSDRFGRKKPGRGRHHLRRDRSGQALADLGCDGLVVDGAVRDLDGLDAVGLPTFAVGAHPATGSNQGPGAINVVVQCGGVTVRPGDVVRGDASGLVVIPKEHLAPVLAMTKAVADREKTGGRPSPAVRACRPQRASTT